MVLQIGADNKIDGDFESWNISWKQIKGNDRSTKDKIAKYLWWENFEYTRRIYLNIVIVLLLENPHAFHRREIHIKTANHTHITWNCQLL